MDKYRMGAEIAGLVRVVVYVTLKNGQVRPRTLFSEYANGSAHAEVLAQEFASANANVVDYHSLHITFIPFPEVIELPRPVRKHGAVGAVIV